METIPTESLLCPISFQLFQNPVMASDGNIYEKDLIKEWCKNNKTSPITREDISYKFYPAIIVKQLVSAKLEKYPELKKEQYKQEYRKHRKTVLNIFKNDHDYLKLLDYTGFDLKDFIKHKFFDIDFKGKKIKKVLFHILNNSTNLDTPDKNGMRVIHHLCFYEYFNDATKYLVHVKKVNIECEDSYGRRPIHIVSKYNNAEMINFFADKGVDLECKTETGKRPIHLVTKYQDLNCIDSLVKRGVELNCATQTGVRPIHTVCRYSDIDSLKYFLEQNIDLEVEDDRNMRPIHYALTYNGEEMCQTLINYGVNLDGADKDGYNCLFFACQFSTPNMIETMLAHKVRACSKSIKKKMLFETNNFLTSKKKEYYYKLVKKAQYLEKLKKVEEELNDISL